MNEILKTVNMTFDEKGKPILQNESIKRNIENKKINWMKSVLMLFYTIFKNNLQAEMNFLVYEC